MIECVELFLSQYFGANKKDLSKLIENELAISFFMMWTVVEKDLFDKNANKEKITELGVKFGGAKLCLDQSASYFHSRYQNKEHHRKLTHGDRYPIFDSILGKNFQDLSSAEKLQLMLYVTYRYRNNIFHGNKGIEAWLHYSTQIRTCTEFMVDFCSVMKKEKLLRVDPK